MITWMPASAGSKAEALVVSNDMHTTEVESLAGKDFYQESTPLKRYRAAREKQWTTFLNAERNAFIFAIKGKFDVSAPVGYWVLLRKQDEVCALRFTTFHHEIDKEKTPHELYWVSRYSDYDWVYSNDGSGDFRKSNVSTGSGHAASKPNFWRFPRGTYVVKCGPLEARWGYPNQIFLVNKRQAGDEPYTSNGIEVAPTAWKNLDRINLADPQLVWYRFDSERDQNHVDDEPKKIPVESLPGGNVTITP